MAARRGGQQEEKGFRNPHNLPVKTCAVCNRPFTWRKKWEKCWDEVLTCSNRCKTERKSKKNGPGGEGEDDEEDAQAAAGGAPPDEQRPRGRRQRGNRGGGRVASPSPSPSAGGSAGEAHGQEAEKEKKEEEEEEEEEREGSLEGSAAEEEKEATLSPEEQKLARKEAKKAKKAARRAKRQGSPEAVASKQKPCDVCSKRVDLLVRCTIDRSRAWKMLCGKCWHKASGGVPDGDADHPYYRYGGLWKNRAAKVNTPSFGQALMAKKVAESDAEAGSDEEEEELEAVHPAAQGG